MRFVPFVGSYVAAIPPVLLAAAVDPGWTKALLTLAVFLIGEPIMGQVLEPLVLGKRAGLSPFAMVLSASFWTLAWGPDRAGARRAADNRFGRSRPVHP